MFESRATHEISSDELAASIVREAKGISRRIARLISLVAILDLERRYLEWGFRTAADWLVQHADLRPLSAREYVRVARALASLPRIREAFESGALSYKKVRAITRVANSANEQEWLVEGLRLAGSELERTTARRRRTRVSEDPSYALKHRSVRHYVDEDGMEVMHARLCPTDAPLVRAVIGRAIRDAKVPAGTEDEDLDGAPPGERMAADGLLHVLRSYGTGSGAEIAPAMFIVDATEKSVRTTGGARLHHTVAERTLCDAVLARVSGRAGGRLESGRVTRTVSKSIARVVQLRDQGTCQFPGCHNQRFLHRHHVRHWTRDRGPTTVGNITLLCTYHHMLVHEGGFQLWRGHDGRIRAKSSAGRLLIRAGPLAEVG